MLRLIAVLIPLILCQSTVMAKHNSSHPLSEEDWQEVMEKVALLEDSVFIPSLLPLIMSNRDVLQLSETQLSKLFAWRKNNYVNMVNMMNHIIEMKVQFSIESLSADIDSEHLIELQREIHRLQHDLLTIRLSCREILVATFTAEQWENLEFIVADDPKLASFYSQSHSVGKNHSH